MESWIVCLGCGLKLPYRGDPPDAGYNASGECLQVYYELSAYTLAHTNPAFLHQHLVDAYGVQHTCGTAPKIRTAFGLIGLYLAFERGCTGREVQRAHMDLGRMKREWPGFEPPQDLALLNVRDVMLAPSGVGRDEMLLKWALSVWTSWSRAHDWARQVCDSLLNTSHLAKRRRQENI